MTKWDKILITTIIVISLGSIGALTYFQSQTDTLYGIIEVNGKEIERINLLTVKDPYEMKVENGDQYNIIRIQQGGIAFIEATCPDKACVRTGWLTAPGETSLCLPNGVTIRVISPKDEGEEPDITT